MSVNNFLQPETLYRLVCRPALPRDTPDVMELTSRIWEGDDYVPYVWADWMLDYQGLLAVAEYGGRVVGLGKLTRLDPASWWLEGLRVHPEYEGRRIASRLHEYLLAHWQKVGREVLRLATTSTREAVKHLCERTGFRKMLEVTSFIAAPIPVEKAPFAPLEACDLDAALEFALGCQTLAASAGLVELDWCWAVPARQHLEGAQERSGAWWWAPEGERRGLLLARPDEHDGKKLLMIQMIASAAEELPACLQDCRTLAAELGRELVAWFAPLHPLVVEALQTAGYHRDWDDALYIYTLRRL